MDKATTYDDYMNFKVIELKAKCDKLHIKPSKLKKDIINQILEHYKNLVTEPEPECIIDEDSDKCQIDLFPKILNGDCLDKLKDIPDSSINLVITSPPYNLGIKYSKYKDKKPREQY